MDIKEAIDFLLFGYFGFTSETTDDFVLDAVIRRAYRDAASHVLSLKDETEKDKLKQKASDLIKVNIYKSLECTTKTKYDAWHQSLCTELNNIYADANYNDPVKRHFSIGIAQKWVNMTVKYLFLTHLLFFDLSREIEHDFYYAEQNKWFHIPLDSIILNTLHKDYGIISEKYGIKNWSEIKNYNEYLNLQKAIRITIKEEVPLAWECKIWLEKALQLSLTSKNK